MWRGGIGEGAERAESAESARTSYPGKSDGPDQIHGLKRERFAELQA